MRFLFSPNLKKAEKQFGDTNATRGENRQEELLRRASELVGVGEGSSDEEESDNEGLDEKTITPRGEASILVFMMKMMTMMVLFLSRGMSMSRNSLAMMR